MILLEARPILLTLAIILAASGSACRPPPERQIQATENTAPRAISLPTATPSPTAAPPPTATPFTPPGTVMPTLPSTPEPQPPTITPTATPIIYVVQAGDTLLAIAALYGLSPHLIADFNGLADPGRIRAGQSLVIPWGTSEAQPAPTEPLEAVTPAALTPGAATPTPAEPASATLPTPGELLLPTYTPYPTYTPLPTALPCF